MKLIVASVALFALALPSTGLCQDNPTDQVGIKPFGSYAGGGVDTVNLENGNVFIRIPLFSLPQLGKLSLSYSLILNNKGYTGQVLGCETVDDGGTDCIQGAVRSTSIGPSIVADQYVTAIDQTTIAPWSQGPMPIWLYWTITDSSNNQTLLGWDSSNPGLARGLDGSGYAFIPAYSSYNYYTSIDSTCEAGFANWKLYTASGISYTSSSACDLTNWQTAMNDPNGNTITFYPAYQYTGTIGALLPQGGVIDSVGRAIPNPVSVITTPASTSCPNLGVTGQPVLSSSLWTVPGPNGGSSNYLICYTTVGYSTDLYGGWEGLEGTQQSYWTEANGSEGAIQSVVLPNGTYYGFIYDSTTNWQAPTYAGDNVPTTAYGDLVKLLLPTGGSISYTYTNQSSCPTSLPNWAPDRFIQSRTVSDANGNAATWLYQFSGPNSGEVTTETDPNGNDTQHIFTPLQGSQCSLAETETKTYVGQASPQKTPIRDTQRSYGLAAIHPGGGSLYNALPSSTTTTLEDNESTTTQYSYPTLFNQVVETCYSATNCNAIQGGPILFDRPQTVTTTGYGLSSSSITATTYEWQNPATGFFANNWLTAVSSTCVPSTGHTSCTPSNDDTASYTTYGYDGNGNVNAVNKWLSGPFPQYITSTSMYTSKGELQSTTDALGNTTQYTYDPSGPGLFPSEVQGPSTNGSSHADFYTYDLNTGNVLTHADQNAASPTDAAHLTTYTYDALGRLVDVKYPPVLVGSTTVSANPETKYCYTDLGGSASGICPQASSPPFAMYSVTTATPNPSTTMMKQFDGLGRAVKSILLSDPQGPQVTDTAYDLLGRVHSISSPYRTKDDPTYELVTSSYDSIGRKTSQSHSGDGSSTNWWYSGSSTTFADEVGNQTTTTTDALGRLTSVVDPAGLSTSYGYDALGNLVSVYQAGNPSAGDVPRVRSFTYDSLSRLVCSSNPESSSASCPASAASGYTSGALGYSYYWNGNLKTKTDTNGVVETRTYDGLNRLLSVVYSNDSASTPSSCYSYDGSASANMIGRLAQEWTMPYGSACPASPPASPITSRKVLAYDAMGRMLVTQQCVLGMCSGGGTPFQLTQTYDLAGNQTRVSQSGISGVVPTLQLSNNYDGAGRLNSMQSSWNGVPNSNDPLNIFSVQSYSPAGVQNWMLGNYLNIQQTYDTRSRPTSEVVTHH